MTKTRAEALAVMAKVTELLEARLKLIVNQDKSKVAPLKECSFLGFQINRKKIRRTDQAIQRFKTRIKDITARSRGGSMWQRLNELRQCAVGWFHYFKIGLAYAEALRLDQWMRRRVRLCFWKNWKWARTRRPLALVPKLTGLPSPQRPTPQKPRRPVSAGPLGRLQIRREGQNLIAGHCLFGTAVIRTRMSGGVRAGGVNAPRYSIGSSFLEHFI
ncbi:group II intron maturase-specific domain-containing protein [Cerasicoccus maritimus]|uniref:group II intron maturase-specific domain-containing protein n=1 Tax=Cerasicoccus maritimus TaxID=490089 RepID=UPI003CCC9D6C